MPRKKNKISAEVKKSKFVKAFIENGGNATQAYLSAVPVAYNTAGSNGRLYLQKEDIQQAIIEACQNNGIDYDYLLKTRKLFVDAGASELAKQMSDESGLYRPRISSSDTAKHLDGINRVLDRVGGEGLTNDSSRGQKHLHLHLETKTPGEILQKRQELNDYFTDILTTD